MEKVGSGTRKVDFRSKAAQYAPFLSWCGQDISELGLNRLNIQPRAVGEVE